MSFSNPSTAGADAPVRSNPFAASEHPAMQIEQMLRSRHLGRTQRLLHIGCGSGALTLRLAAIGYEAVGVDCNPRDVQAARQAAGADAPDCTFATMFATNLAFDDASFDVVVAVDSMSERTMARAAAEIDRVLKPGGLVVFQQPLVVDRAPTARHALDGGARGGETTPTLGPDALRVLESRFEHLDVQRFTMSDRLDRARSLRHSIARRQLLIADHHLLSGCRRLLSLYTAAVITAQKPRQTDQVQSQAA